MRKTIVLLFCLILLSSVFSGCTNKELSLAEKIRIGVVYYDKTDTFIGELLDIFREEIQNQNDGKISISVSMRDSDGSQRIQNRQVEELINEGCDVLLVNLVDRSNPSQVIDSASKKDVPVIFFNREPVAEDLLQWDKLYYIGADARQSGQLQGEEASDYILSHPETDKNGDGIISYVLLEGEPGHQDAIIRTEAVLETLESNDIKLEKLGHAIANWSRPQAKNRMGQLIRENGDSIELILSNNDDMAIGAVEAYESMDETDLVTPAVFGIDGTDVGLNAVLENRLVATVYNDKVGQGQAMAKLALAIAQKKDLGKIVFTEGKNIYLPYAKVDGDNIDDYIKKDK